MQNALLHSYLSNHEHGGAFSDDGGRDDDGEGEDVGQDEHELLSPPDPHAIGH